MASTNRMSMYSVGSSPGTPRNVTSAAQQSSQVSTTTLLNTIHTIYTSGQPYKLDAGSSVVVNTWLTASQLSFEGRVGGIIDFGLAAQAWEHARRRAEDGCIFLGYVIFPVNPLYTDHSCTDLYTNLRLQSSYHSLKPYLYRYPPLYILLSMPYDHSYIQSLPRIHLLQDIRHLVSV